MAYPQHPTATQHLPLFITAPGETDVLLAVTAIVLVGGVLAAGVFFLWLHSLPERMVHNRVQFDIVAVLALLSLFTHIHAFWVVALLIALIKFPDFSFPDFSNSFGRMASSLEKMADTTPLSDSNGRASKMSGIAEAPADAKPLSSGHATKLAGRSVAPADAKPHSSDQRAPKQGA